MAATGRPPKPIALKQLEGTYRPDRDPGAAKPKAHLPSPPAHMPAAAKREWRRMGKALETLGLMTDVDAGVFEVYCTARAQLAEATKHLEAEGRVVFDPGSVPDEDGYQERPPKWITSPWVAVQRTAIDQLLKAAREFGMSPSSRAKAAASEIEKPAEKDELANVLAMRRGGA